MRSRARSVAGRLSRAYSAVRPIESNTVHAATLPRARTDPPTVRVRLRPDDPAMLRTPPARLLTHRPRTRSEPSTRPSSSSPRVDGRGGRLDAARVLRDRHQRAARAQAQVDLPRHLRGARPGQHEPHPRRRRPVRRGRVRLRRRERRAGAFRINRGAPPPVAASSRSAPATSRPGSGRASRTGRAPGSCA